MATTKSLRAAAAMTAALLLTACGTTNPRPDSGTSSVAASPNSPSATGSSQVEPGSSSPATSPSAPTSATSTATASASNAGTVYLLDGDSKPYVIGEQGLPMPLSVPGWTPAYGPGQQILAAPSGTPEAGTVYFLSEKSIVAVKPDGSSKTTSLTSDVGNRTFTAIAPAGTPNAGAIYLRSSDAVWLYKPNGTITAITVKGAAGGHPHPERFDIADGNSENPGLVTIIGTNLQITPSGKVQARSFGKFGTDGRILAIVPAGLPHAGAAVVEVEDGIGLLDGAEFTVLHSDRDIHDDITAVVAPAGQPNQGTIYVGTDRSLFVISPTGGGTRLNVPGYGCEVEPAGGPHPGRLVLWGERDLSVLDPGAGVTNLTTFDDKTTWESLFTEADDPVAMYWAARTQQRWLDRVPRVVGTQDRLYVSTNRGILVVTPSGKFSTIPMRAVAMAVVPG